MFSYLRPSNRRSALPSSTAPPQATSSRYYHVASTTPLPSTSVFSSSSSQQTTHDNVCTEASPVSPDPPILPPIPRVASQHEKDIADSASPWGPDAETKNTSTRQSSSQTASLKPIRKGPDSDQRPSTPTKAKVPQLDSHTTSAVPERPLRAQSKQKRPIDLAYESMRAYSEPPRQTTFGNTARAVPFLPQPNRKPPPPPPPLSTLSNPLPPPQRQAPPPPSQVPAQAPPIANHKNHGKAKLNLLNPMALLARRRSSQAVEAAFSQSQSTPRLPDDFDPSIRGKVVHDFSAPRQSRPVSSNEPAKDLEGLSDLKRKRASPNERSGIYQEDHSPGSTEKEYTPVFKENFDDDVEPWSSDVDKSARNQSPAFLYQVSFQSPQPPDPSSLPAFARNLPTNISHEIDALRKTSSPPLNKHLEVLLEPPTIDQKSATSSPPTSPPPKTRSRATSLNDSTSQSPGPPQRFKSNASRFSFDLAGVGSAAQEKLLEEKHREKARRKERESVQLDDDEFDDDDAFAGYEDMDDAGLEEGIPGVNVDADETDDDTGFPGLQQNFENMQFVSPNKSSFESATSAVSTGLTSPATPRDIQGQGLSFPISKSTPDLTRLQVGGHQNSIAEDALRPKSTPDGLTDPTFNVEPFQQDTALEANLAGLPRRYPSQGDDDMYFDDGMIEDLNDAEAQPFDESVFDDDSSRVYGLALRDLKPLLKAPSGNHDPKVQSAEYGDPGLHPLNHPDNLYAVRSSPRLSSEDDTVAEMRDSVADLNQPRPIPSTGHTAGLTQDNLGLHDQLALAANQAALEGRFNRTYSNTGTYESYDDVASSQKTAMQDNHLRSQIDGSIFSPGLNDDDDFAFDDTDIALTEAEDDDPIIAAANAEALENDDEGFYGQEFGFFARKPGSSQAEYANGGYFGPRALEGIHRMNSGRDNFIEPSLTPITERSEWSNRNSMVSLGMHGFPLSSQYPSNPQLTDLMRVQEGREMSLEELRKLRRCAWGGSDGSLQSSSNSPNGGSPLTYLPPPGMMAPFMQPSNSNGSMMSPNSQNLAGSFQSLSSDGPGSSTGSGHSPSGESPTITISPSHSGLLLQIPPQPIGPPPPPPPAQATGSSSPVKRSAMNPPLKTAWAPGHSRTSSGAESVSYREENGRWFCERTRLIDETTGEIEVLGRSVVEGGRI